MARTIQVKRGARSTMPTLEQGELGFVTDNGAEELYVGNGTKNIQIARQDYVEAEIANIPVAQSDWNQNDESAPDFVKNRPFYSGDPVETVCVNNVTVNFADPYEGVSVVINPFSFELVEGRDYVVMWNGVRYDVTAGTFDDMPAIGNHSLTGVGPNTNEPFLIFIQGVEYTVFSSVLGNVPISISSLISDVTKINKKYLPILVGEDVSGKEYSILDTTFTAGTNAEIFNDYKHNAAAGEYSHAEGTYANAVGKASHAEGSYTYANGDYSHAEGFSTYSDGNYAHSEGYGSNSIGKYSHTEGYHAKANGEAAHAEGSYTIATRENSHVQGQYNIEDTTGTLMHIVGNGGPSKRSNAHTVDKNGEAWFAGDVYVGSTSGTNRDAGSKKLLKEGDVTPASIGAASAADLANLEARLSTLESSAIAVLHGTSEPASSLGEDGALYLVTE